MGVKCPRCRTLCSKSELRAAVFDKTNRLVRVAIGDASVYVSPDAASKLNLIGSDTWGKEEIASASATRMMVVDTSDGPAFITKSAGEKLGYAGREYWKRQEDAVCGACIEELARGKRAHRSYSSKRNRWRSV